MRAATPWPRPIWGNDYLTVALVKQNYDIMTVTSTPTGSLNESTVRPLVPLTVVAGTLYQVDFSGALRAGFITQPATKTSPIKAFVKVRVDFFDVDSNTRIPGFELTDLAQTFTIPVPGSQNYQPQTIILNSRALVLVQPTATIPGDYVLLTVSFSAIDDNGAPQSQLFLRSVADSTLLGIKAVAVSDAVEVYKN